MLPFKIKINESVRQLIDLYTPFSNEVGGAVFGSIAIRSIDIKAISFKHGDLASISFTPNDKKIFVPPDGMKLLGTWHTHPNQGYPLPSYIDIMQWKTWDHRLIHIIFAGNKYSIFNYNGNKLMQID